MAARFPFAGLLAILMLSAVAAFGLTRLQSESVITTLFKSEAPEFLAFDRVRANFPTDNRDILVVVSGERILSRENVERLGMLQIELLFLEHVENVASAFSLPEIAAADSPLLIPDPLPDEAGMPALIDRVLNHELVTGRLVNRVEGEEGAFLFVVSLNAASIEPPEVDEAIAAVRATAADVLGGTGLGMHFLGTPVMDAENRRAGYGDRLRFNIIGFALVLVLSALVFRRFGMVTIIAFCPGVAVLWLLGAMGLIGLSQNLLTNTLLPFVIVITFSNAVHLLFAVRKQLQAGQSKNRALEWAVRDVGPACVLTTLTTCVAFLSLTVAETEIVRTFGQAGAVASLVSLVSVLTIVPVLGHVLLRREAAFWAENGNPGPSLKRIGNRFPRLALWSALIGAGRIAAHVAFKHWRPILPVGLALSVIFGWIHFQVPTEIIIRDQLPRSFSSALEDVEAIAPFSVEVPFQVEVTVPEGADALATQSLQALEEAHRQIGTIPGIVNVWSLAAVRNWYRETNAGEEDFIRQFEELPPDLTSRFVSPDRRRLLLLAFPGNPENVDYGSILAEMNTRLDRISQQRAEGELEFVASGLPALTELQAPRILNQLKAGLTLAVFIVIVLIAFAFRSLSIGLLSVLPNILPIFATGALILALGRHFDFAGFVGLTVAFGLAVDDTIHVFNRYRIEALRFSSPRRIILRTFAYVAPVLIITSAVLILGIGVTFFAEMPPARTFGALCVAAIAMAVIADLFLLPACMLWWSKLGLPIGSRRTAPQGRS